ncbi:TonB-dependent receptor [Erythrobacter arachoides]|uniref:TonB-dependent receptor n=1 Tax=Aurantiacibacter arachoides TaxID=1850444 RepID=A0A845A8L9_9SPHN|nr:TonB-dependent receptor [Aurantiacibacter arachoides]MXO93899.1 TonB-dependent receptor [Aurantiacibacter arachoides]GGD45781.1 TonB-dependent receptor [Aurantiacibacter arachoides]
MTGSSGRKAFAFLTSTAMLTLTTGTLHAQDVPRVSADSERQATVTGRVFDAQTGNSLRGAVVSVAGTNERDVTTEDGRFQIQVPAGTSTIEVEYVGLDSAVRTVDVPANGTAVADIGLDSTALSGDQIVVRANAVGQALAINQQRTADGIVNIYSEEIFGPAPDGNIGYALQRLPGISVNTNQSGEPTGVNIRGVEGDYNSFQINGNRLPSAGGARGLSTSDFSADGISNIEVIKAATPDRDGDAIGGIINVVTRSAFERSGRRINVEAAGVYSDLPEDWGYSLSGNYSDIFSLGGDFNNFGVSVSLGSYEIDRTSLNRDMDWVQVTPENNPQLNLDQYDEPVWFMESSHWEIDKQITQVNTANIDLDFRTDAFNSFYLRGFYSQSDRTNDVFETDIDIDTRFQDAIGGRKTYAELTPTTGRGTPGNSGSRGSRGWIGTDEDRTTELYSINFGGRHEMTRSLVTYDLFYSRSEEDFKNANELNFVMEPDNPWFVFEYTLQDVTRGEVTITEIGGNDSSDLSLVSEGELVLESAFSTENIYNARVDFERSFDIGESELTLKTGGRYFRSEARRDVTADVYEMDEDFPYADILDPTDEVQLGGAKIFNVFPSRGVALLASNPELFELNEEDTLEDSFFGDFNSTEETIAGYGMGTLRAGIHTIIAGVRYESIEFDNTNFDVSFFDGEGSVTPVRTRNSYDFWLPGIHFRHELMPNLILRESYNRSYGRPRRSELASGRFTNEDGDIVDGNPNLRPAVSENFDAQVEYYTTSGGLYSVGVFYKDISDFSFDRVYNFDQLDANGIPIPDEDGAFEYEVPTIGTTAQNYGLELIARQRLVFLPGPLRGLTAGVSATFTETQANYPDRDDRDDLPLPGFSDFLFTATLEWAWQGFNIRADYINRSDYVEGLGSNIESDEFFGPEERLDISASYEFGNGLRFFGSVINLTDESQFSYQGFPAFAEDANLTGRKVTVGLGYSF